MVLYTYENKPAATNNASFGHVAPAMNLMLYRKRMNLKDYHTQFLTAIVLLQNISFCPVFDLSIVISF
jgi:hypothetical protein